MELDRSHIGKLVQLITDSWSMTGTLKRVDQHDNREWEIAYPSRALVPVRGEIYTTLHIGPWVGDVIGNQPVTVETVAGTLEAPETATKAVTHLITEEESAEARALIQGTVAEPDPEPPLKSGYVVPERVALAMTEPGYQDWAAIEGTVVEPESMDRAILADEVERGERTINSARAALGLPPMPDLPPEPPAEWHKAEE